MAVILPVASGACGCAGSHRTPVAVGIRRAWKYTVLGNACGACHVHASHCELSEFSLNDSASLACHSKIVVTATYSN